jgi:hypothetical protein
MTLKTLADVRSLIRRLPKDHRTKSTWQHVEKQLNAAALGTVDTVDVAVPLRLVLQLEHVPCAESLYPRMTIYARSPLPAAVVCRSHPELVSSCVTQTVRR